MSRILLCACLVPPFLWLLRQLPPMSVLQESVS